MDDLKFTQAYRITISNIQMVFQFRFSVFLLRIFFYFFCKLEDESMMLRKKSRDSS